MNRLRPFTILPAWYRRALIVLAIGAAFLASVKL